MLRKLLPCNPKYYRSLTGYTGTVAVPTMEFCTRITPPGLPVTAYVICSDAQYKLPHTVADIIILPLTLTADVPKTIRHEIIHIIFRKNPNHPAIHAFARDYNMVRIAVPKSLNYHVNPDTADQWGLIRGNHIITAILLPGESHYRIAYYTIYGKRWHHSTIADINYYNNALPFEQNYHPHEMIAATVCEARVWNRIFN